MAGLGLLTYKAKRTYVIYNADRVLIGRCPNRIKCLHSRRSAVTELKKSLFAVSYIQNDCFPVRTHREDQLTGF